MTKTLFAIGWALLLANLFDFSANLALLNAATTYVGVVAADCGARYLARRAGAA